MIWKVNGGRLLGRVGGRDWRVDAAYQQSHGSSSTVRTRMKIRPGSRLSQSE
ncbi:hypothetical protein EDF70_10139 [Neorhizobium sp. JUb45]|nr:hypothetical protein EDF70_10139 [Neorhizobium sp. JUb45]